MAILAPFRGLIYNFDRMTDLSKLVAPPYDVISWEDQDDFYNADPHNVIRLILAKKRTGDSDWDNAYTRAAEDFRRWESEGVLIRDTDPRMYLTSMTYNPGNGQEERTRWGLIALVKIEDEGSGVIIPHEKTFSAHRDDRLRLFRSCNAQFSQIFGLYEDPKNRIQESYERHIDSPPQIEFDLEDGSIHKMWILKSASLTKEIMEGMHNKSIFIADGHHRYETSRNYRNIMRARYGRKPANRSYEYVMMYLTNMNDEGLTILPSHRLVKTCSGFDLGLFLEKMGKWFHITDHPFSIEDIKKECVEIKHKMEELDRRNTALAFYQQNADRVFLFTIKKGAREEMGDDLHASLKKLDVLVLSRFIFQKGLGFTIEELDNENVFHYESSMEKAILSVENREHQMAFLLNPTKMDHVKEVAGNSLVMPRKSTFFYPKVLTGLVFNRIDPYEIIQFT